MTPSRLDVLAQYQHENGGFGGLVYEFAYQGACLKCTEHACGTCSISKNSHPPLADKLAKILCKIPPFVRS
jgi:hypothetical protein